MLVIDVVAMFGQWEIDNKHDVDGKQYAAYLKAFKEPTHYHARYPYRHFLPGQQLGPAPLPPEGETFA